MEQKTISPLISVITPSLNQGVYLEDNLTSVMKQDYLNIEHIIIDGGSTDQSIRIIEENAKKSSRIRWISEPDNGQADAINKGFKLAQGEIVTWLNADDAYIYPDTVHQVSEQFAGDPEVDVFYGDVVLVDQANHLLKIQLAPPFNYQRLLVGCYIKQPALFFRRKVIRDHLLNPEFEYALDYEFWLRIGKEYRFKHISQLLAADRNHPERKILAHRDLMHQESTLVSDFYESQSKQFLNIFRWLDYKINVGLRTRILGMVSLMSFYRSRKQRPLSLNILLPPLMELWRNQLYKKNKNLF